MRPGTWLVLCKIVYPQLRTIPGKWEASNKCLLNKKMFKNNKGNARVIEDGTHFFQTTSDQGGKNKYDHCGHKYIMLKCQLHIKLYSENREYIICHLEHS